jgi:hypothetical protein
MQLTGFDIFILHEELRAGIYASFFLSANDTTFSGTVTTLSPWTQVSAEPFKWEVAVCDVNNNDWSYNISASASTWFINNYEPLTLSRTGLYDRSQYGYTVSAADAKTHTASIWQAGKPGVSITNTHSVIVSCGSGIYLESPLFAYGNTRPLTGWWRTKGYGDVLQYDINGTADYNAGTIYLNMANAPLSAFADGNYNIRLIYSPTYGFADNSKINGSYSGLSLSTACIKLSTFDDTLNFSFTASLPQAYTHAGYVGPSSIVAHYYAGHMAINPDLGEYRYTTIPLSAQLMVQNTTTPLESDRQICWQASKIDGDYNHDLRAFNKQAPTLLSALSTTVCTNAAWGDTIQLTSSNSNSQVFKVSCWFNDPLDKVTSGSLTYRHPGTYLFSYEPIISEQLEIVQVSANLAQNKQILHLANVITTNVGVYYDSPTSNIMWTLSTDGNVGTLALPAVTSLSGLVILDFTDTRYLSATYPLSGKIFGVPGIAYTVQHLAAGSVPAPSAVYDYGFVPPLYITTIYPTVTAQEDVWGPEYLSVMFPLSTHQTFLLSGCYVNDPSNSATYIWTEYVAPTAIRINIEYLDNDPFIRTAKVKAYNTSSGTDKPIHYFNKIAWGVSAATGGAWATKTDGSIYNLNGGLPTDDTLMIYITTPTFTNAPGNSASWCNFLIQASAVYTEITPNYLVVSATALTSVDSFPDTSLFNTSFTFNYEPTGTSDIWRVVVNPYPYTVVDKTFIGDSFYVGGTRVYNIFGTPSTGGHHSTKIGSIVPIPGIDTVTMIASAVSGNSWFASHTLSATELDVHFVSQWLSSDFIVYPSYVFLGDAPATFLDSSNYTLSRGVCAYNHGHTETFNLSARDSTGVTYTWDVNGRSANSSDRVTTIDINDTSFGSLPINLSVYNATFPVSMPRYYHPDNGSPETLYPNISTQTPPSDRSNLLFQSIKMVPYETPTLILSDYTTDALVPIPGMNTLSAVNSITYPVASPVDAQIGSTIWTLSSPEWATVVHKSGTTLNYTISIGDGSQPGTVRSGRIIPVAIYASVDIGSIIPYTPPFDWEVVYSSVDSNTVIATVSTAPTISIFTDQQFAVTSEVIMFENLTQDIPPGLISGFIWYDGFNPASSTLTFDPFYTTYSLPGVYSVTLSAVTIYGFTYSRTFNDIVTVEPIATFEEQVVRIYGVTDLKFPYTKEQCRVPPNEWITYSNMNNTFNKLLSNIQYLKNVSKFYSPPPKYFIGWLGSTIVDDITGFHWNVNISQIDTEYNSLTGALTYHILSAANDIAFKDDTLYVADGNTVQILSGNYAATPISKTNEKTVGDYFVNLKAIGVDTDTRIYVLDAPKNRVVVFTYNPVQIPNWKMLFSWGTLGGANARNGFNNPNDLFVDKDNIIWIADTGNSCIKKYTRTGSWLQTITSSYFSGNSISTNGPISVTLDQDGYIYVLVTNGVVKLTNTGEFVAKFLFAAEVSLAIANDPTTVPRRVRISSQGDFIYVCFSNRVVKITTSGLHGGTFANTFKGIVDYTSLTQNENGDLFITNQNTIIRFAEDNVILSVYKSNTYEWTVDDIHIEKNEFEQPWVINRSIARIWDNIELFRRSITGKIIFTTLNELISGYQVVDFTPDEYDGMEIQDKGDTFVGVNELVTRDVFNRCVDRLYDDMSKVLDYL